MARRRFLQSVGLSAAAVSTLGAVAGAGGSGSQGGATDHFPVQHHRPARPYPAHPKPNYLEICFAFSCVTKKLFDPNSDSPLARGVS
jgi:hypothetical protein